MAAAHPAPRWADLDDPAVVGAADDGAEHLERAHPGSTARAATGTLDEVRPRSSSDLLETGKLLTAGGVAGAVSKTCTAPLARLTILYQVKALKGATAAALGARTQQVGLRQAFAHVVQQEGVRSLWKGNAVTIIHRLPYSAVNFYAYERLTELWQQRFPAEEPSHMIDITRRLLAGGASGLLACSLAYPLDLVRTRLAAQTTHNYYTGIGNALATIVRDEGAAGLYRGLGATLAQVAPSLAINYAAYETLRSYCVPYARDRKTPTVAMSLACGSAAGLISSTATFPLDLVRRRMQLEGQGGRSLKYRTYGNVVSSILRKDGMRGFYAGILPEYCKVVPGVAIAFCIYEGMKGMLGVTVNTSRR